MQQVSATYTALISQPHRVESKLEVWDKGGVSLVHTFGENEIASLSTRRSLFSQNNPSVGGTVSGEIDCELYNEEEYSIPRMAMLRPYVKLRQEVDTNDNLIVETNPFYINADARANSFKSEDGQRLTLTYADPSVKANIQIQTTEKPKAGQYTLSFDCEGIDKNDFAPQFQINGTSGVKVLLFNGRISQTFTLNQDRSYFSIYMTETGARPSNTNIVLSNVKLEYGDKETPLVVKSEWIPKGVYWIDTRKKDYTTNKVQIHGYDAMLKGEQLFEQGTTVIDWPRTDIQVLNGCVINDRVYDGVAQKMGVTIQSDSLAMINREYMVQFPGTAQTSSGEQMSVRGAAMTVREVLGAIGAMYCGNWTIDEDGTMRFVQLGVGR